MYMTVRQCAWGKEVVKPTDIWYIMLVLENDLSGLYMYNNSHCKRLIQLKWFGGQMRELCAYVHESVISARARRAQKQSACVPTPTRVTSVRSMKNATSTRACMARATWTRSMALTRTACVTKTGCAIQSRRFAPLSCAVMAKLSVWMAAAVTLQELDVTARTTLPGHTAKTVRLLPHLGVLLIWFYVCSEIHA